MVNKLNGEDKRYLKEKLGEYSSAKELRKQIISLHTLNTWRKEGKLESVNLYGIWYYSLKSVNEAIQTAETGEFR